jgi:hypothetical protein
MEIDLLKFKDAPNYEYHLTNESLGLDIASVPLALEYAFVPSFQYKYDADKEDRPVKNNNLDMGAFEYFPSNFTPKSLIDKYTFFPNPTKDIIYFSEEIKYYKIWYANGALIKDVKLPSISASFHDLSSGVYFIQLENGSCKKVTKGI